MGLLDGQTQQSYYQGNDYGSYQFTSLNDIINQFMVVYVGEDKIIPKAKRLDVAFHAQRALAELSFDTFKSCKAQEITVTASLQMVLPQDYVNYTKISWVDSAGIKHLMYPTSKTSNPSNQYQDEDGLFQITSVAAETPGSSVLRLDAEGITGKQLLSFTKKPPIDGVITPGIKAIFLSDESTTYFVKTIQHVSVVDVSYADVVLEDADGNEYVAPPNTAMLGLDGAPNSYNKTIRFEKLDGSLFKTFNDHYSSTAKFSFTMNTEMNLMVIGTNPATYYAELENVRPGMKFYVHGQEGYGVVTDVRQETETVIDTSSEAGNTWPTVYFDSFFPNTIPNGYCTFVDEQAEPSDTWNSYKSANANQSDNHHDSHDHDHDHMLNNRYGLDPQHAQANGSFYIDCVSGKIHFSSNISGKTVILDYISDSLGTDGEMQVHKFAEEAMYKWISHAILSGRANIPEYQVNRFKKERFAAVRTAKLRLSNLKLEELTQILRGKSKQIKH
tara:strand:+ start:713 stop:2215 length:1503 start_codon:yes stop_codon:yes gene_type:complete